LRALLFGDARSIEPARGDAANDEAVDEALLAHLDAALRREGRAPTPTGSGLGLPSGIHVAIEWLETHDTANGGKRTVTRTFATHADAFAQGLCEYQHGNGPTFDDAIATALDQWVRMDLAALEDALQPVPTLCTLLEFEPGHALGHPTRARQVVFGPVAHLAPPGASAEDPAYVGAGEHAFCPCCLFTRSLEAFAPVLAREGFSGIRLFAARHADGTVAADCRVDGGDFADALEPLKSYASTWPGTGLEFRKQYVVVRDKP
jgi:hypothetical protein